MGGSRLTPSSCFGGGRRVPLRAGAPPRAPRERRAAAGWKRRRAVAGAPGRRECHRGRPLLARAAAVRATRERTTPRAAAALRRPPSPRDAPQPGAGTRACSGGSRGALSASPHSLSPELRQAGPGAPNFRWTLSPPGARHGVGRRGGQMQPPLAYSSVGKRTELPPVLGLRGIAQSALWGRGPERTVLGSGMREDEIQLNEPSFRGRGRRPTPPPSSRLRLLSPNYISHGAFALVPPRCTPGVEDLAASKVAQNWVL